MLSGKHHPSQMLSRGGRNSFTPTSIKPEIEMDQYRDVFIENETYDEESSEPLRVN